MMLEQCKVSCGSCSGSLDPTSYPTYMPTWSPTVTFRPTPSPVFSSIIIPSIPTSAPTVDTHSCNNGSITQYNATGYTAYCCRENFTNGTTGEIRSEIMYAYVVISGQPGK